MCDPATTVSERPVPLPPWWLEGEGYIFPLKSSRDHALRCGFLPPSEQADFLGGWGVWMLVRYRESPVGPYDELLYIPGCSRRGWRLSWQISKIYVSTQASARAGIRNWGLPKEVAPFEFTEDKGALKVRVGEASDPLFTATLRVYGPRFPIVSLGTPPSLRQPVRERLPATEYTQLPPVREGEWLQLPVLGRGWGWSRLVSLGDAQADPSRFPDVIESGSLRTGIACLPFRMNFSVPRQLT